MDKFFYPRAIAIVGLSSRENNLSRLILGNLIRWGYKGRLFGVNPRGQDRHVDGIRMYREIGELPEVPDLAVALLPARFVPDVVRSCGRFGIRQMAIPSGGFNEAGAEGQNLADELMAAAREYGVRFIGPNGLTIVNTANGLCLPFTPLYCPPKGSMSVITQSGGMGLFLWNLMADQNIGLAKFASIGNKLDLGEVDFLHYFASDPETEIICLYVESIVNGRELLAAASKCPKPVVVYKANTTGAGSRAAMSHTAAISNDDAITDTAFARAGIIRINSLHEFISVTKAFSLPPMRGERIMAMSPAGGFAVVMADLCDKAGFTFADPGEEFYRQVASYGNAGIINVSNPLDMGDMYDPRATAEIFHLALHNDNIDGAIYINQWPRMPVGDDIFSRMFHTDLSQETMGAVRSSGKPLGVCLFGPADTITRIKNNLSIPIFDSPEEMVRTLKIQQEFHARKAQPPFSPTIPDNIRREGACEWLRGRKGIVGEEAAELLALYGIASPAARVAGDVQEALAVAGEIGYPVVLKIADPQVVHKSDVGGVVVGIGSEDELRAAWEQVERGFARCYPGASPPRMRVMAQAPAGVDMFVGGCADAAFGPVVVFGYGGIYVEVFADIERALCPTSESEVREKLSGLRSRHLLAGARGSAVADIDAYVDLVMRVACLLADFPAIRELDINPVRIFEAGKGAMALDCRARIE